MPEPDYISVVFKTIKDGFDGFTISESDFRNNLSKSKEYRAVVS